jgi:hypothetical protein
MRRYPATKAIAWLYLFGPFFDNGVMSQLPIIECRLTRLLSVASDDNNSVVGILDLLLELLNVDLRCTGISAHGHKSFVTPVVTLESLEALDLVLILHALFLETTDLFVQTLNQVNLTVTLLLKIPNFLTVY